MLGRAFSDEDDDDRDYEITTSIYGKDDLKYK